MNKTKKNRKNSKTFRNRKFRNIKLKKGGMEKDDTRSYVEPSYIEEKKEEISKRKDNTLRSERRGKSKQERQAQQQVKYLDRQLNKLDINPSSKRTHDEIRGNYLRYHKRKSPKRTELSNYDKNSSNVDLSHTVDGMEDDYMQHVLTQKEHDEMINRLEEEIKQIKIENQRLREKVLTQTKDNK